MPKKILIIEDDPVIVKYLQADLYEGPHVKRKEHRETMLSRLIGRRDWI